MNKLLEISSIFSYETPEWLFPVVAVLVLVIGIMAVIAAIVVSRNSRRTKKFETIIVKDKEEKQEEVKPEVEEVATENVAEDVKGNTSIGRVVYNGDIYEYLGASFARVLNGVKDADDNTLEYLGASFAKIILGLKDGKIKVEDVANVVPEPIIIQAPAEVEPAPVAATAVEESKEEPAVLSLKESLATARSGKLVTKKSIVEYLKKTYGAGVELNNRPNYTAPAKGRTEGLPLADTHYTLSDGKRACFLYVYETNDGVLLLIKAPREFANKYRKLHKNINMSAFPKSSAPWYSVAVDESYTENEVYEMISEAKLYND